MARSILYGTARELWILTAHGYRMLPITADNPCDDESVKRALKEVTPYGVIAKVFGNSDALLIKAGQRLQVAAGWADPSVLGDEDEDGDDDDEIVDSGSDPTRGRS